MKKKLVDILNCPKCFGDLELVIEQQNAADIETGKLICQSCKAVYPVLAGIPRFVEPDNYASSFGYQWNNFKLEQLDSFNGTTQSADRFYAETRWSKEWLRGKWILDAGCGAGRFLDIASQSECEVVGIDISSAIEASKNNLADRQNVHFVQASIYELPFKKGVFDGCYCIGVIQHTPNPAQSLESLPQFVKENGQVAVTIYERKPWTFLNGKYLVRPLTRRISKETLLKIVRSFMFFAFPVIDILFRLPFLGRLFRFIIPVAIYVEKKDLTRKQRYDWALLDTFDMLSPTFDQPQTQAEVEKALQTAGIKEITRIKNHGLNLIGRKG